ncbi:MAG: hypothetical protein MUC83_07770 [Pirellula sp.]|jgi:hypothetical protein|nr:hypothetical protein [Pirellula sp.]
MSTATMRAPTFVQTQFNWDEEPILSIGTVKQSDETSSPSVVSRPSTTRTPSGQINGTKRGPQPTNRIGGCVHVGSPLVKVLGKYGFTLDDLLIEIERQKKAAS